MNVTYYASEAAPCVSPLDPPGGSGAVVGGGVGKGKGGGSSGTAFIRATCSKYYNHLVFEWAR